MCTVNIDLRALPDLTAGITLLGNGGGGAPEQSAMVLSELIHKRGPVPLVEPDDLPDDAWVITVSVLGTPTAINEKIPSAPQFVDAVQALERHLGIRVSAVMPLAIGGMSALTPLFVAAETGVPCVNADGARRAVSQIEMSTLTLSGLSASPMAVADDGGNHVIIHTSNNRTGERLARAATMEMGLSTALASYPMTGAQLKAGAIRRSFTYALDIGRALRRVQRREAAWGEFFEVSLGRELVSGKIIDIERKSTIGFAQSTCIIESTHDGSVLRLEMQNELLIAIHDGVVVQTTPELLCMVGLDSAQPLMVDELRVGEGVRVLSLPCADEWRVEGMDAIMGPKVYGYEVGGTVVARRRTSA